MFCDFEQLGLIYVMSETSIDDRGCSCPLEKCARDSTSPIETGAEVRVSFRQHHTSRGEGIPTYACSTGRELWVSPELGTNQVACAQCHPNGANTHPETYQPVGEG